MPAWGEGPDAARRVLQAALGEAAGQAMPAFPVLASPGWHGVDATHWQASGPEGRLHLKLLHPDAAAYVDAAAAIEAARLAGELGVGPAVLHADPSAGALLMPLLEGWRVATLERLYEPAIQDAILAARRRLHAGPPLSRHIDIGAQIDDLARRCALAGASLPEDVADLRRAVATGLARIAAAGVDLVPAHGDGMASNHMLGPDGQVLLVDFDLAGMMDPFLDIGSFIGEAALQEPEARALFERWHGHNDEGLFARAMIYAAADDLRFGLIGALLARTSRRRELEFVKYGNWRFLRCRMAIRDPRFAERCRRVR